jgi:hypothetical protein
MEHSEENKRKDRNEQPNHNKSIQRESNSDTGTTKIQKIHTRIYKRE